jgi:putative membrane protein
MMFWNGGHWVFWQVALMWVGMLAFWGLIVWAFYAVFTGTSNRPDHEHRSDEARRILDQRLARGEIDTEEYRRLRELITQEDRTPVGAGDKR